MSLNENAKKWVEALRSGEYRQGKYNLHSKQENGEEMFCCLGVACKLYQEEVGDLNVDMVISDISDTCYFKYNGYDNTLPYKVVKWLGLSSRGGRYGVGDYRTLASLALWKDNDEGKSFNEISHIIESEPEGLFK